MKITQKILDDALRAVSPLAIIPKVDDSTGENYFAQNLESIGHLERGFGVDTDGAMPSTGSAGSIKALHKPKRRK